MTKFIKVNNNEIININCIYGLYTDNNSVFRIDLGAGGYFTLSKEEYNRISKILLEANND